MKYLEMNNGFWRVRVTIPADRRDEFDGKRYLLQTTHKKSLAQAEKVAEGIIADFLRQLGRPAIRGEHLRNSKDGRRLQEWYTPPRVFECMDISFDIDVASPGAHVVSWIPALRHLTLADDGLSVPWHGCVWVNPPYGLRFGMMEWLQRFVEHGDGVMCLPNSTYTSWSQWLMSRVELALFVSGYIRFINGQTGKPGTSTTFGTVLFSIGERGCAGLRNASRAGLGALMVPATAQ